MGTAFYPFLPQGFVEFHVQILSTEPLYTCPLWMQSISTQLNFYRLKSYTEKHALFPAAKNKEIVICSVNKATCIVLDENVHANEIFRSRV